MTAATLRGALRTVPVVVTDVLVYGGGTGAIPLRLFLPLYDCEQSITPQVAPGPLVGEP